MFSLLRSGGIVRFLDLRSRARKSIFHPTIGFLTCGGSALAGIAFFKGTQYEAALPLAFLLVVTTAALLWGCAGAMAGLLCGAAMFAFLLFPPIGSLAVSDNVARANLGWMLLLGIPTTFLLARAPR
jgi:K+-sensing histidine kinase KdpD